jgi:phosphoribosylformylglycinamidine synthase PurS subunit
MIYNVQIKVMLLKDLLDPQGKAVQAGLKNLGLNGINDVRIGKHITLQIEASSEDAAKTAANDACKKLLVNPVMEFYEMEMVKPQP